MKTVLQNGRLQLQLIRVRSSLWFVPTIIILGTMVLAIGLTELDQHVDDTFIRHWPRIFITEAEGARGMLSAIATSMATVAGVAFSITVVAQALASSQYTSRVLRNFMRDPANQVVLGVFVGVYIYCLLVLRTISGGDGGFVPSVAVLGALVLAIFASGAFIFFIHHISASIQASEIIATITRETIEAIDLLFPEESSKEAKEGLRIGIPEDTTWRVVPATKMGYIQTVDMDRLLEIARQQNTVVRMECSIGDFVSAGVPLAALALSKAPDSDTVEAFNRIYATDSYRTIDQDPGFGIRQLVDISLKALSPGINDTTTAVTCIEHLAVLLARCAPRQMATQKRFDGDTLRVIAHRQEFSFLFGLAFHQILEVAEGNTEILLSTLGAVEKITCQATDAERLYVLKRHVDAIEEAAMRSVKLSTARQAVEERIDRLRALLEEKAIAS